MTIDEADKTYTGCDKCVHANDPEDVCRARLCIHAINHLKECYKPVRPTGHWIMPVQDDGMSDPIYYQVRCSKCGFDMDTQTWHEELKQYGADKFCPNCGAKMEVSE